jgi:hypothetical protein
MLLAMSSVRSCAAAGNTYKISNAAALLNTIVTASQSMKAYPSKHLIMMQISYTGKNE